MRMEWIVAVNDNGGLGTVAGMAGASLLMPALPTAPFYSLAAPPSLAFALGNNRKRGAAPSNSEGIKHVRLA